CGLATYDIAPLIPIIEGAGGCVTAWDGGPALNGGDVLASASPRLHQALLEIIARTTP
ncbi:MAG: inositol monophosphatase family protein, partial [Pseudomonadota bacterium]